MKYLLLIAFVAVVWWVWKKRSEKPASNSAPTAREPEAMVTCAHCGVHLPKSDSVSENGVHFCTDAHRLAAKAPAGDG
jgi:uncharacterized protein